MEAMELSLDDYIKTKKPVYPKKVNGKPGFRPRTNTHPAPIAPRRPAIEDARSKIIQKNRAKIRDVRDLISAKKKPADARYVITKNMTERLGKMGVAAAVGGPSPPRRHHRSGPVTDRYMLDALALDDLIPLKYSHPKSHNPYHPEPMTSRDDHYNKYHYHREDPLDQPRRRSYVDYDAVEDTKPLHSHMAPEFDMLFQDYISTKQGAVGGAPPRYKPSIPVEEEDVFDLYEAPARDRRPLPPAPTSSSSRRFVPTEESSHLSYEMRSRLEGSQSAPKSMGIFANPTKALPGSSSSSSAGNKGYRVLVTNLHSSVTVWDIQELFADIGGLLSADFVKPGVAEVVYKTMKDAEDAVEVYHNRQLDGQPMKCHMITQPPPPAAKVPAYHGGGFGGSGSGRKAPPLELDLDTLHSALFTKKRH